MELQRYHLAGQAQFDGTTGSWAPGGDAGWTVKTVIRDPHRLEARVTLGEVLATGYSLVVTPQAHREAIHATYHGLDAQGFHVVLTARDGSLEDRVGFSFRLDGLTDTPTPDDRTLVKDHLVEDIHVVQSILAKKAQSGMITVMCSASINQDRVTEGRIARQREDLDRLYKELEQTQDPELRREIEAKITVGRRKMVRYEKLMRAAHYWDSAHEFGKLWGAYYAERQKSELGGRDVPICTGGGPGIMQAVANGAASQRAIVLGIDAIFGNEPRFALGPQHQHALDSNVRIRCNDFAIREAALINYANVVLFWPGGLGTSWEAFETLCKIQTGHLRRRRTKAIFVHTEFWRPLYDYVKHLREIGTVNAYGDRIKFPGLDDADADDAYVGEVVDSAQEAFEAARAFVERLHAENALSLY
ncbi:LOG family protein [Sulfidibacter corallicola]|uniref:AMP nucleosidase n=1 Tax=Sulfidibacter corallicola TaxID=2818388 RepID=A0A8A4TLI6_SULCO|nr:LOG family protein [Sulfidibacter corallicola]QTD50337.1 LOG family protein [Sulfidibacter corallicola]